MYIARPLELSLLLFTSSLSGHSVVRQSPSGELQHPSLTPSPVERPGQGERVEMATSWSVRRTRTHPVPPICLLSSRSHHHHRNLAEVSGCAPRCTALSSTRARNSQPRSTSSTLCLASEVFCLCCA
ncbi:hypothetical protein C2E23DRAFT_799254 [Lenzites betulinus]|nr:hypothetical protein C2E23DRAFT_799254 [Lenzites betulinus]